MENKVQRYEELNYLFREMEKYCDMLYNYGRISEIGCWYD